MRVISFSSVFICFNSNIKLFIGEKEMNTSYDFLCSDFMAITTTNLPTLRWWSLSSNSSLLCVRYFLIQIKWSVKILAEFRQYSSHNSLDHRDRRLLHAQYNVILLCSKLQPLYCICWKFQIKLTVSLIENRYINSL